MNARLVRSLGCAAVWVVGACAEKPTEVELRLYPCMLGGGAPTSVELEIINLDAKGAELGQQLAKTFMIGDPGVFEDGYATVGFKPPGGTVTADIKVTWKVGEESVSATYLVEVPGLGESISLGDEQCEGGPGTTTNPTMGTSSDTTTTGSTTGTGTETGTTANTTVSTTTSTTTSTGTGTTETTTGTTTGTTDMTTDTSTGTTSGGPQEGQPCGNPGALICNGEPGTLGELLQCDVDTWVEKNDFCTVDACMGLGFTSPQIVGCIGDDLAWGCACAENPKDECMMAMTSECGGTVGDGVKVDLCIVEGPNTWHYSAQCPDCTMQDGQPMCIPQ